VILSIAIGIVVYHIEGGGHTWPGGSNLPVLGRTSALHASEVMWALFEKHPMPGEP
jgi:poly(3-hydroxybutyrate) depolymerase